MSRIGKCAIVFYQLLTKNIKKDLKSIILEETKVISVLIPTYNYGHFIGEAIESVLQQNVADVEIIVVDDGSNDNTKDVVAKYKQVKYYYQEHKGISAARNLCLSMAKRDNGYIAFIDADDIWLESKLQEQLNYFDKNPDCDIVFTHYKNEFMDLSVANNETAQHEYNVVTKFYMATALIKKEALYKCGTFSESLTTGEDTEMLLRLAMNNVEMKHCIPKILYRRRLHGSNITLQGKNDKNLIAAIAKNLKQRIKSKY